MSVPTMKNLVPASFSNLSIMFCVNLIIKSNNIYVYFYLKENNYVIN